MAKCICMVQEEQIPASVLAELEAGLKGIIVANDISENPVVAWIEVPKGEGWTAGKPSTSSVVAIFCQDMEQDKRVSMLQLICDLWTAKTGCSINEIVAMIAPAN